MFAYVCECSKFWCRNRPGDEMDKYNSSVQNLVISEEDIMEGKCGVAMQYIYILYIYIA